MINNFETVIGIEVHLELNTNTKIFSSVKNGFVAAPNTLISQIDLGYPGTLPSLNKQVVVKAIKLAKALNMKIDNELHFDRKNYYYTDLPKGFQITQQFRPIGIKGFVKLNLDTYTKEIKIERIHIEEDTARQQHHQSETWINYNRAGVPLIEIVSCPDIRTKEEAAKYIENLRELAVFLDISNARMAEGSLRADINISTRLKNSFINGTKVEIKNLNSINNIKKAIEFESNLQIKKILNGEIIEQETKRFDENTNQTTPMRTKKDSIDYCYFPEPNIPVIKLEQEFIDQIKLGELPNERRERYKNLNISSEYIEQLINNLEYANFIDEISLKKSNEVVKMFFSEIVPLEKRLNTSLANLNIKAVHFQNLIELMDQGVISGKQTKLIIPKLMNLNVSLNELLDQMKIRLISDADTIIDWINLIHKNNVNLVSDFRKKPEATAKFVIGEIMKISKGQANPVLSVKLVKQVLRKKLKEYEEK